MNVRKKWFLCLPVVLLLAAILIYNGAGRRQENKTEAIGTQAAGNGTAGTVLPEGTTNASAQVPAEADKSTPAPTESANTSQQPTGEASSTPDGSAESGGKPGTAKPSPSAGPKSQEGRQEEAENTPGPEKPAIVPDAVDDKVQSIAEGEVGLSDYAEIIKIIAGKLSVGEIKYLFDSAKSDYWESTSVEDIEKARDILFSKLSEEDITKLTELGKKFGRSMDILKKDIDVAETKEKQMRKKGLIE